MSSTLYLELITDFESPQRETKKFLHYQNPQGRSNTKKPSP